MTSIKALYQLFYHTYAINIYYRIFSISYYKYYHRARLDKQYTSPYTHYHVRKLVQFQLLSLE